MQPKLELLSKELINRILEEALQLLIKPGIKVQSAAARELLLAAGAKPHGTENVISIPDEIVQDALATVPNEFYLYNHAGEAVIRYGGDAVHFDPGSSAVHVLDPDTQEHRPAITADLVKVIKLAETLPQYDAQSTALVCHDVPTEIGDLYRLYLVLLYSQKPVVTGAFSAHTTQHMIDMLAIYAGGRDELRHRPRAVFDVCPSPPLIWSEFGGQNLIDLAHAGVPAEIVSMPLAGAAAPVTLLGSIVQHAAESLSGIAIHQLANPGAPVVWGGAPAIMDMRHGTTPMGAVETAMLDIGYAQVAKFLDLPTHTYLGASDAKLVDAQAGLESGITTLLGALAGINMISGAGMLDFLACFSPEKLVIDAEAIGMAKRLLDGIHVRTSTLATELFEGINFKGDFLKQKITRQLFSREQTLPSEVIDRGSVRAWQSTGQSDAFQRARQRASELLANYQRPDVPKNVEDELHAFVGDLSKAAGLERLPQLQT